MTRLKLTLCSVMRVSALEGTQDKEIAKITPTDPGERNGRFVGFLNNPHRLLPFLDCNLVPRVFSVLLVNEKTLGTRFIRLIVGISQ